MNNMQSSITFGNEDPPLHDGSEESRGGLAGVFLFSTSLAILFLVLLLFSVIDSTFGFVAIRYEMKPSN